MVEAAKREIEEIPAAEAVKLAGRDDVVLVDIRDIRELGRDGQVPGAFGPMARRLQQHYGLSKQAVEFWDVHEMADADHSDVGDHVVVRHATDAAMQARVRDALQHSLDAWWHFFDSIQAAI